LTWAGVFPGRIIPTELVLSGLAVSSAIYTTAGWGVVLAIRWPRVRVHLWMARGMCGECGYNLKGLGVVCPECGEGAGAEA
jgi:hypothetical protein